MKSYMDRAESVQEREMYKFSAILRSSNPGQKTIPIANYKKKKKKKKRTCRQDLAVPEDLKVKRK